MAKIFLSHSKADKEVRDFFLKVFGLAGVQAVSVEFEYFPSPPWQFIKDQLDSSDALFLLLGPNVIDRGIYTQNWISFEIGIACQLAKEIWVFEQINAPVRFPVPYLDHYVLYDPENRDNLDYIRRVIEAYKVIVGFPKFPSVHARITCPNEKCKVLFNLCIEIAEFECPSCRKMIKLL
jgi:hypothetical protein